MTQDSFNCTWIPDEPHACISLLTRPGGCYVTLLRQTWRCKLAVADLECKGADTHVPAIPVTVAAARSCLPRQQQCSPFARRQHRLQVRVDVTQVSQRPAPCGV